MSFGVSLKTPKMKKQKKAELPPAFKNTDEYAEFAQKHHVYGAQARDLKNKMDKLTEIPQPKIK